ncbi:MAG TPA: hypothetical protein VMT46_14600 [Anaerolineaceae bacterium]|nr:hypothetical protein [Anaerolineaceae bacterium]
MAVDNSTSHSCEAPEYGFRTFLIVWITQSISVFGTALTFFAIITWLIQVQYPLRGQKKSLARALSANGLTFGIPNVAVAPFAGAWADRHDCKRTMMAMDFFSGLAQTPHELQGWVFAVRRVIAQLTVLLSTLYRPALQPGAAAG